MQDLQAASQGQVFAPTERWNFNIEALGVALGAEPKTQPAFVWKPSLLVRRACALATQCGGSARLLASGGPAPLPSMPLRAIGDR